MVDYNSEFFTQRKIIGLIRERKLDIKKHAGQNFLIDRNLRDKIISFAELSREDTAVEIGAGLGALTSGILGEVEMLYCFEIDEQLSAILKETFSGCPTLRIIEQDFLQTSDCWWDIFDKKIKVISNTPYYISTSIVYRLLAVRSKIEMAILTVQKEVGEKLVALPGNKNYGPISVLLSIYTNSKICYSLNRTVFFPKPDVGSVVVKLIPLETPRLHIENEKKFLEFLPLIFSYRRKKILNVINRVFDIEKDLLALELIKEEIPDNARAEELEPEQLYRLFRLIDKTVNSC